MKRISLAVPHLTERERANVIDCIDSTWISSIGKYIGQFEECFAEFCGVDHAVATNNGTTALHLALVAMGVGPGDEVLVPTLTYIATANAVTYCGATPVLVDSCPLTMNIDPVDMAAKITPKTRGVIPVHLYGHPAQMVDINRIADEHGLWILEDAAEAHGATVENETVGSLGTCASFSFFGNKIVTTGEGGMVTTNDEDLAENLRLFRGQGMDPNRRYWFPVIGFNYRMTNIQAAIGVGQMEGIDRAIAHRDKIGAWYEELLAPMSDRYTTISEQPWANRVIWAFNVFSTTEGEDNRDRILAELDLDGIESRPVFYPMHRLPPYKSAEHFPVADSFATRGITLPAHQGLERDDIARVVDALDRAAPVS